MPEEVDCKMRLIARNKKDGFVFSDRNNQPILDNNDDKDDNDDPDYEEDDSTNGGDPDEEHSLAGVDDEDSNSKDLSTGVDNASTDENEMDEENFEGSGNENPDEDFVVPTPNDNSETSLKPLRSTDVSEMMEGSPMADSDGYKSSESDSDENKFSESSDDAIVDDEAALIEVKSISQDLNDLNHKTHHQENINDNDNAIEDQTREQASADAELNAAEHVQPPGVADTPAGVAVRSTGVRTNVETADEDDDDEQQEEIEAKIDEWHGKWGHASVKLRKRRNQSVPTEGTDLRRNTNKKPERPVKPHEFVHLHAMMHMQEKFSALHESLSSQCGAKKGPELHEEAGAESGMKELRQIHKKGADIPLKPTAVTSQQKKDALRR